MFSAHLLTPTALLFPMPVKKHSCVVVVRQHSRAGSREDEDLAQVIEASVSHTLWRYVEKSLGMAHSDHPDSWGTHNVQ